MTCSSATPRAVGPRANVFAGYLDDPSATERVLTADGWLRTGDIGYCDEDGFVYLVDRAKDLIIVSGFNVFPAEVEEVLPATRRRRSGCRRCPAPAHGRSVKAFVVLADGQDIDEETLIDHARDHLARYNARARSSSSTSCRATPPASCCAAHSTSPPRGPSPPPRPDGLACCLVNSRTSGSVWSGAMGASGTAHSGGDSRTAA